MAASMAGLTAFKVVRCEGAERSSVQVGGRLTSGTELQRNSLRLLGGRVQPL